MKENWEGLVAVVARGSVVMMAPARHPEVESLSCRFFSLLSL